MFFGDVDQYPGVSSFYGTPPPPPKEERVPFGVHLKPTKGHPQLKTHPLRCPVSMGPKRAPFFGWLFYRGTIPHKGKERKAPLATEPRDPTR